MTKQLLAQAAVAVCIFAFAQSAPAAAITDLGGLLPASYGLGVNESGQVAGYNHNGNTSIDLPFLYSNGTMQNLGTLGGDRGRAHQINDSGQVTGYARISPSSAVTHAFRFSNDVMSDIGTLGGSSEGWGINNLGDVVGMSYYNGSNYHAFHYRDGEMIDLGSLASGTIGSSSASDVNESRVVVGYTYIPSGKFVPFRHMNGSMQTLPLLAGSAEGRANAINNVGGIVGEDFMGSYYQGFVYNPADNSVTNIGGLAAGRTTDANDINDAGLVVGTSFLTSDLAHAVLWQNGVLKDLNSFFPNSGWELLRAYSINEKNQIVGMGISPDGEFHAYIAQVPEPASVSIVFLGLLSAARRTRRISKGRIRTCSVIFRSRSFCLC